MPLLDDLKKPGKAGFKKKAYRSWNLLEFDEGSESEASPSAKPEPTAPASTPDGSAVSQSTSAEPATTGHKKATTAARRNRAQKGDQQGTTTGHNRAQDDDQQGTTGHNRAQKGDQQGTTTGHNRAQKPRRSIVDLLGEYESPVSPHAEVAAEDNEARAEAKNPAPSGQTPFAAPINRAQKDSVPGWNEDCARLNDPLCPVDAPINRAQPGTVPGSDENCARLQPGTERPVNRAQTAAQPGTEKVVNRAQNRVLNALPSSAQLLTILDFMAAQQQSTGLEHTPRLKRAVVAMTLGISLSGIKNQLARLCANTYLERVDARDGRGEAGTVYRVPPHVVRALQQVSNRAQKMSSTGHSEPINRAQDTKPTGHKNRAQEPGTNSSSSSSFLNNTTTNENPQSDRELYEQFREALTRYDCHDLLGPNDVMQTWRKGAFENVDDLLESVEHVAAYAKSAQGENLKSKKGWMMKTLAAGYYGKPEGFKSWGDKQREERRRRVHDRQEERRVDFECEFDLWLAELPTEQRKQILHEELKGASNFVSPTIGKKILRNRFAQQRGLFEFVSDEET